MNAVCVKKIKSFFKFGLMELIPPVEEFVSSILAFEERERDEIEMEHKMWSVASEELRGVSNILAEMWPRLLMQSTHGTLNHVVLSMEDCLRIGSCCITAMTIARDARLRWDYAPHGNCVKINNLFLIFGVAEGETHRSLRVCTKDLVKGYLERTVRYHAPIRARELMVKMSRKIKHSQLKGRRETKIGYADEDEAPFVCGILNEDHQDEIPAGYQFYSLPSKYPEDGCHEILCVVKDEYWTVGKRERPESTEYDELGEPPRKKRRIE